MKVNTRIDAAPNSTMSEGNGRREERKIGNQLRLRNGKKKSCNALDPTYG
jgi:hypothetical protein